MLGGFLEEAKLDLRPGLRVGVDRWRGKVGPGELWWGVFSSFQGPGIPLEGLKVHASNTPPPEGSLSASNSQGVPSLPPSTRSHN